jgi:flavin-dependent dehydrogenase
MYVTPVSENDVCVALITRRPQFRFDQAFPYFPALAARLDGVTPDKDFLGALTMTRKFKAVQSRNIALIGEASGSVDAVTGEGLSLAFHQAFTLAEALRSGNLLDYEAEHRRIARLPRLMSSLMLTMDRYPSLRRRALRALSRDPDCFAHMLAVHIGARSLGEFGLRHGLNLGWNLRAA